MPRLETPKRIGNATPSTSSAEKCGLCDARFVKGLTKRRHMRLAHPEALAASPAVATATNKQSAAVSKRDGADGDEWVSCGACSLAVRTRGELIRHVERRHIRASTVEQEVVKIVGVTRDDANQAKAAFKQTSKGCPWVEHMYIDRTVNRCKGLVGRTYVQSIGGQTVKVQKICPATVIVEPSEGTYEVLGYWRHVGHDSVPLYLGAGLARRAVAPRGELCAGVRYAVERTLSRLHLVSDATLNVILEKVKEIERLVQDLDGQFLEPIEEVLLPSLEPEPTRPKPRAEEVEIHNQKSEADKAVDDALQKYIKAKNPVIKLQPLEIAPKIVSAFSLKEEQELDSFVKDMEMLVNNGRSFEATENRSRMGKTAEKNAAKGKTESKSDATVASESKSKTTVASESKSNVATEPKSVAKVKSESKYDPVAEAKTPQGRGIASRTRRHDDKSDSNPKKPDVWPKSNFNDTFKDFISKEFKYQDTPKGKAEAIKKPSVPVKPEKKRSLTFVGEEEPLKLNEPVEEIGLTEMRMRHSTPKSEGPAAKRRKTIHVDGTDGRTPIVTVGAPRSRAVGLKSAASEPSDTAGVAKSAAGEPTIVASEPKRSAIAEFSPKVTRSTPKSVLSAMDTTSGPVRTYRGPNNAEKGPKSAEKGPKIAEKVPTIAEKVPKIAEKVPKIAEKVPKIAEKVPKIAEKVPKIAEKVPKIAEKEPKSAVSLPIAPKSRRLTIGSIAEVKAKSRTGLKTKRPSIKPKSKITVNMNFAAKLEAKKARKSVSFERTDASEIDSSLERESTKIIDIVKNEEFIVKEQDNDVNILIIRM